MFDRDKRYITKRVQEELPIEVILFLYNEIDELIDSNKEIDYLQVFNISVIDKNSGLLEITHSQEIPVYKKTIFINNKEIKSDTKIFVIDEQLNSIMMIASEY